MESLKPFLKPRQQSEGNRITVRGIVSPAGWDADGEVVASCIAADNSRVYFIAPVSLELSPLDLLKEYVTATGDVTRVNDRLYIAIEEIEVLEYQDV